MPFEGYRNHGYDVNHEGGEDDVFEARCNDGHDNDQLIRRHNIKRINHPNDFKTEELLVYNYWDGINYNMI